MTASNDEGLKPADKIARATYIPYEHGGGRLFYLAPGSGDRELIADFYREDTRDYILEAIGKIRRAPPKPAELRADIEQIEKLLDEERRGQYGFCAVDFNLMVRIASLLRQAAGRE
jgi:hypothetical protein